MADAAGEISVELRLALTKLRQDIADARRQMEAGLNLNLGNVGSDSDKAATGLDRVTTRVRSQATELRNLAREWAAVGKARDDMRITIAGAGGSAGSNGNGHAINVPPPPGPGRLSYGSNSVHAWNLYGAAQAGAWHSTMGNIIPPNVQMPQFAPPVIPAAPPVIPPAPNPLAGITANSASGMITQAISQWVVPRVQGAFGGAAAGGGVAGAVAGLASLGVQAMAVAAGLKLFHLATQAMLEPFRQMQQSFQRAAGLYASVVHSGNMAPGWVVQRHNIAQIMGVSEQEIIRVGDAFRGLSERTKYASATLTQTMGPLTGTVQNWRIMSLQIHAFFAKMAEAFAPLINEFTRFTAALVQFATAAGAWTYLKTVLSTIFLPLIKTLEVVAISIMALNMALVAMSGVIKYALKEINNAIVTTFPVISRVFGMKHNSSDPWDETKSAWDAVNQMGHTIFGSVNNSAAPGGPNPNRLPSSAFERMGLVIGANNTSNYARDTAQNTRATVSILQKIQGALSPRSAVGQPNPAVSHV